MQLQEKRLGCSLHRVRGWARLFELLHIPSPLRLLCRPRGMEPCAQREAGEDCNRTLVPLADPGKTRRHAATCPIIPRMQSPPSRRWALLHQLGLRNVHRAKIQVKLGRRGSRPISTIIIVRVVAHPGGVYRHPRPLATSPRPILQQIALSPVR